MRPPDRSEVREEGEEERCRGTDDQYQCPCDSVQYVLEVALWCPLGVRSRLVGHQSRREVRTATVGATVAEMTADANPPTPPFGRRHTTSGAPAVEQSAMKAFALALTAACTVGAMPPLSL